MILPGEKEIMHKAEIRGDLKIIFMIIGKQQFILNGGMILRLNNKTTQ